MIRYITILIILVLQSCVGQAQSLDGTWAGLLDFGSQKLKFVTHLTQENGHWSAKADSPDQGAYGIPFEIQMKGDSVILKNKQGISLELVKDSSGKLSGHFKQNGVRIPVVLTRNNQLQNNKIQIKRSQSIIPPYSYDTLEVNIPNNLGKVNLSGTITQPKGNGVHPAVILITGSGPQDRDETLFGHKPFKVLADYLTRHGIIVLRYDERGVGKSSGVYENATIEDFSKDAVTVFNYLKQQKNVDPNKIGIIGHSEGGLIANLLAGQGLPHLSFIVSLAGPTISIRDLMVEQLYTVGKAEGLSEIQLKAAREVNQRNFDIVKSNLNTDDAFEQLKKNMSMFVGSSSNTAMEQEMLMMLTPAYRYFLRIEPQSFIEKIHIPVFGAFGTLDVQVPSTLNLRGYYDNLPKNSKSVLKEYDGMNHLFQRAKTGKVAEYAHIEETMNEQVLKDIADWINSL